MSSFVFEVSEDRSRLTLSGCGDAQPPALDAAGVDALIRRLSECRATMRPVHPATPPAEPDRVYLTDNLLVAVHACTTAPVIEIAMQHPGLGWTVTKLSRDQAEDLQTSIEFALHDIRRQTTAA